MEKNTLNNNKENFTISNTTKEMLLLLRDFAKLQERAIALYEDKTECADRALLDGALSGWHEEAIEFCHLAEVYDIGVTPLELTEELKRSGIFNEDGLPDQRFVDCGYFRVVEMKYVSSDAETNIIYRVIVYPLGIAFISGFTDALKDRKRQSND